MNLFFSNFLKTVQSRPSEIRMEIETPPVSWEFHPGLRTRMVTGWQVCQGHPHPEEDPRHVGSHCCWVRKEERFMETGDSVVMCWCSRKNALHLRWSPLHQVQDADLLFFSWWGEHLYFPRNLALGHAWLAGQNCRDSWRIHYFGTLWWGEGEAVRAGAQPRPLLKGNLCARGGILLGKESYLGFVVFLWFLLSICSTHDCKMCFLSQRVMATWYDGPVERKTTAVLQTSTSLKVCEVTVFLLSDLHHWWSWRFVVAGFMSWAAVGSGTPTSSCVGELLVNEASQPSHMKIIGGLWNIVVLISMGKELEAVTKRKCSWNLVMNGVKILQQDQLQKELQRA